MKVAELFAMSSMAVVLAAPAVALGAGFAGPVAPMSDVELAGIRGGYLSVNGITFGFGASVSTYVDGTLALQTRLTLTDAGLLQSQVAGAASGAPLDAAAQTAGLGGPGVVFGGQGGATTIMQNLTGNQILNLVVNGASNRTITQNTAVTLTLPAFNQLQQSAAAQQLSASLLNAVGVGAVGSVRH